MDNNEIKMQDHQTEADQQTNLRKTFEDSEILEIRQDTAIIDKTLLENGEEFVIVDFYQSKYGKIVLNVEGKNEDLTGRLQITNKVWNYLLKTFGTTKADLINKKVLLHSKEITVEDKSGESRSGFQVYVKE